ncbi:MAG TPA: tail fiber domain-containing protein [Verrucomicrobiae bacterium]|nr:tail fiber domain-containing protein [Verrucomicrobiae bacterium]
MNPKLQLNILLLVLLSLPAWARAQGTAFSYQGNLLENGVAANGGHDFIFSLFDSAAAGAQVGQDVTLNNTRVANGQFNVSPDFGPGAFPGSPRWLEISVRPTGVGQFTKMDARVSLLPTPYAVFATTAGNVANGAVTANQLNTGGLAPAQGQFLSYNAGNLVWSDPAVAAGNVWSLNGLDAYYNAGNVGIGTANPTNGAQLEVKGTTRISPGGSGGFVSIGTPNGETGMGIIGSNRADIRFDGSTLKLLAGFGSGAMPATNGIAIDTSGNVGIGTTTPYSKLSVAGSMLALGDVNILGGRIALNRDIFPGTTVEFKMSPGDSVPLRVEDSAGKIILDLTYNPNELTIFGDAQKLLGGTSWGVYSDRRLKQDVRAYEPGLKEVLQLRPVRFHYPDDPKRGLTSNHEEFGFIAQEVREVIPEAVTEGKDGYLSLKADPIHWAAINAIQELNAKLLEQRAELKQKEIGMVELREKNNSLEKRLEALEQVILLKKLY